MIPILSLVTSVKDYFDVVHKLVEFDASSTNINYENLGNIITYLGISLKNGFVDLLSFTSNLPSIPVIVPDISSAMISEVSVLNVFKRLFAENTVESIHTAFNILETSKSPESINLIMGLEKFTIGVLNSIFLCLPTSTAHIIILRRFVMQGLEAGYMAGLGTIAGNLLWLASVLLGWRFFVIPWLSLDIFRYVLGFVLLVKYMCDCYGQPRHDIDAGASTRQKIFFLNFLLALTEQTSIYPFISNLSFSAEASLMESFPAHSTAQFWWLHALYLLGIGVGSFSLLQLTCWFFEKPGLTILMSVQSLFQKMTTSIKAKTIFSTASTSDSKEIAGSSFKILNFTFLYLTMASAITSIPYYGLDYTITNPLGYVNDDRIIQDKQVLFSSFLGTKASDRNTRRNPGRHGRRERWKRRIRKFRTFDASLYDQGVYDLFTVEDLNYGFDRFWLRRKLRNHNVKFKFFPGPWMRTFKKQLLKPKSNTVSSIQSPFADFFRILFEQAYSKTFFARLNTRASSTSQNIKRNKELSSRHASMGIQGDLSVNTSSRKGNDTNGNSTLRKFVRKVDNRLKNVSQFVPTKSLPSSKNIHYKNYKNALRVYKQTNKNNFLTKNNTTFFSGLSPSSNNLKFYKNLLQNTEKSKNNILSILHPLKFYQRREAAFERKLRYYTPSVFRKFSVENNAPHFRVMMRRFFYNYKPTNRWERTMKVASLRKARRKTTRTPRVTHTDVRTAQTGDSLSLSRLQKPTHSYSGVSKRASRYRFQIYKDVLQHWYYSPFNRFLLKMDVDSFIRRQPNYILSAAEENLLHLRRFLLAEHNNTLRWYSNMEHYRLMKDKLGGGTKSFSSRVYNQQFAGTFKKIRHLFFVTPKQQNTVLKFDQPLYNEHKERHTQSTLLNTLVLHEELNPRRQYTESYADLLDASTQAAQQVSKNERAAQNAYVRSLLNKNDYATLTQFIYNKKTITRDTVFNSAFPYEDNNGSITDNKNVYVTYLKNWKRQVADLEALKHYSSRFVNNKRVLNGTKKVLSQLEHFAENPSSDNQKITLTSGLQKAISNAKAQISSVSTNATVFNENNKKADDIKLNFNKSLQQNKVYGDSNVPTKLFNIHASLLRVLNTAVSPTSNKNTKYYISQKERALSKQKRLRKEFQLLNKQQPGKATNDLQNTHFKNTYVTSMKTVARKKRENEDKERHVFTLRSEALKHFMLQYKKEPAAPRNKNGRHNSGVYRKRSVSDTTKVHKVTNGTVSQQLFLDDKNVQTPVTVFVGPKTMARKLRVGNEKRSKFDMKRQKYRKKRRTTLGKIRRESKQAYKKQTIQNIRMPFHTYIGKTQKVATQPIDKHRGLLADKQLGADLLLKNTEDNPEKNATLLSSEQNTKTVNKLYENLFIKNDLPFHNTFNKREITTNLPFYAGWDELLRKFVVTNRMLSRQDAGYTMTNNNNEITFTKAPLKGMNAATTLYWQIPFTTYDPDQYFSLGLDGFSPISWRKFLFRHSVLKNSLTQQKHEKSVDNYVVVPYSRNNVVSTANSKKTVSSLFKNINFNNSNNAIKTKISRHLKKRYRRVKKHPRTPVTFPSGALINQVLPVHYIYVFYKRSRLPRDRYLLRRLVNKNDFKVTDSILKQNNTDFTLRKRLKPRREYHSLREVQKTVNPRRLRLLTTNNIRYNMLANKTIKRPVSEFKKTVSLSSDSNASAEKEYIQGLIKDQKAQRFVNTKQRNTKKAETQLKRRVLQTTLRTVWRYRPRAGGFIWPGDYSLLEQVEAPQLSKKAGTDVNSDKQTNKTKKRRELLDWQGQPKKYLYEKHNLKVLKKKLKNK